MPQTTNARREKLILEYLPPSDLIADPKNPRLHKPPQIAAIARSISTFGFNMAVLADSGNMIIAGHGRVAAALRLKIDTIPVVRIDHLSPAQRQAYMVADNRLSETSSWNEQLLGEVLRDLSVADLDFELDAIGFSVGEIDMKIEALTIGAADDEQDVGGGRVADGPVVTQLGDVWTLGRHRLLCGDALLSTSWDQLMNGAKAQMIFADVPYNIRVNGFVSGLGKVKHSEFCMASGEMDPDQFTAFLTASFRQMATHAVAGSLHYVCIDWRHLGEMVAAGESAFTELKNMCVWDKGSGAMGSLYRSQHELVFVWKSGRGRHKNNVELGRNGRNRTNLWRYPGIAAFRHSEGGDLLADHPTSKPVRLVADAILDVTARGDIVVDPFMGSGTTLIAAERVGRTGYGLELDPRYCDAVLRRYETLTGESPIREASGETFAAAIAQTGLDVELGA